MISLVSFFCLLKDTEVNFEEIIFQSEKFALVDKNGTIRAYYNGMKSEEMKQLKKDINALLKQDA